MRVFCFLHIIWSGILRFKTCHSILRWTAGPFTSKTWLPTANSIIFSFDIARASNLNALEALKLRNPMLTTFGTPLCYPEQASGPQIPCFLLYVQTLDKQEGPGSSSTHSISMRELSGAQHSRIHCQRQPFLAITFFNMPIILSAWLLDTGA